MTKAELGVKRDCPECGARFYDLNKSPAECPKCQHEFVPEALLKPRKGRPDDEPQEEKKEKETPETSLEDADKEAKAAEPKRAANMDGEADDDDDEEDDDELSKIADIEGIDLDDDDEDETNDALLDDDDDDGDVGAIVPSKGDD